MDLPGLDSARFDQYVAHATRLEDGIKYIARSLKEYGSFQGTMRVIPPTVAGKDQQATSLEDKFLVKKVATCKAE